LKLYPEVVVLRLGHRVGRDKRISTHVGLVARAFGARAIIYFGEIERSVVESIRNVVSNWGGRFEVYVETNWRKKILELKNNGWRIVHLTMYGINIAERGLIEELRGCEKLAVVVGAEKVPAELYSIADYNVAIGNQPHSEVAALAVFLDRLYGGKELCISFPNYKLKIIPSARGKMVVRHNDEE